MEDMRRSSQGIAGAGHSGGREGAYGEMETFIGHGDKGERSTHNIVPLRLIHLSSNPGAINQSAHAMGTSTDGADYRFFCPFSSAPRLHATRCCIAQPLP